MSVNSTKTGIIYGYGTFTINSATVATWNMYKNDATKSPKQTTIDSLLICNTFNTGSAICPYTAIPTNAVVSFYSFIQVRQCHNASRPGTFHDRSRRTLGCALATISLPALTPEGRATSLQNISPYHVLASTVALRRDSPAKFFI